MPARKPTKEELAEIERLDPKTDVAEFIAHDPDEAGCVITLRGPLAEQAGVALGEVAANR